MITLFTGGTRGSHRDTFGAASDEIVGIMTIIRFWSHYHHHITNNKFLLPTSHTCYIKAQIAQYKHINKDINAFALELFIILNSNSHVA